MPPYLSPLHIVAPSLPAHCEPANEFLYSLSANLHTCVPTNLAFISTLLGTCSIISWLFAQLPQIYKNYHLKSTSGLSIFFLAEWLLGDLSNLLGCIFTQQASWQVIIAIYYVFVDCALCIQWVWYALLKHGRPLRPIFRRFQSSNDGNSRGGHSGMQEVWDGVNVADTSSDSTPSIVPKMVPDAKDQDSPGRNIPHRSNPNDAFRIPNFARSPSSFKESSPMPSPKTVLYISLVLAILSNTSTARLVSPFSPAPYNALRISSQQSAAEVSTSASEIAGKVLSWMSTVLYLGSRLPQLYMNYVRKSTAGLSPTLFAAAFFGNFFYSTSLLTNPCAWDDFAPGEGAGWVGLEGSVRSDWVLRAAPFFLGAAGVLIMDAAVGVQFWCYGDNEPRGRPKARDEEIIVIVDDDGDRKRRRFKWRRVSGWMRGWVPAVSVAGTPSGSRAGTPVQTSRDVSPSPSTESGRERGALDEARALLGTERTASPRSYGGVS
ncbi:PQ loop repeat-domain-containing protein [Massariosphaeria phaeospora]|uniref:PQ loop repeat-domain-containing protein n=1 Tax=Massariosphaeria phaeospora TaxID=100035 RepID=A0A7C8I686_9PLEO|nr:PQ loop repeat-domain-containing protein [Massariosphaeria phaeospora]